MQSVTVTVVWGHIVLVFLKPEVPKTGGKQYMDRKESRSPLSDADPGLQAVSIMAANHTAPELKGAST